MAPFDTGNPSICLTGCRDLGGFIGVQGILFTKGSYSDKFPRHDVTMNLWYYAIQILWALIHHTPTFCTFDCIKCKFHVFDL